MHASLVVFFSEFNASSASRYAMARKPPPHAFHPVYARTKAYGARRRCSRARVA